MQRDIVLRRFVDDLCQEGEEVELKSNLSTPWRASLYFRVPVANPLSTTHLNS
jgi:hypothetical protein